MADQPQQIAPSDVVKVAAWLPVSAEMSAHAAAVRSELDHVFDRLLHPWNYPDQPTWPARFVLIPWLERLTAWWERRRSPEVEEWDD